MLCIAVNCTSGCQIVNEIPAPAILLSVTVNFTTFAVLQSAQMLFNSIGYLFFLPLTVAAYYTLPRQWRWVLLLIASYLFYAFWNPAYVLLLMASTGVSYFAGIKMSEQRSKPARRPYLFLALAVNLGLLFAFKYLGFFTGTVNQLGSIFGFGQIVPYMSLLLPVGISFYTFQSLGYVIDVYRGSAKAEHHAGLFALYVSFFPQLVAGPIERARNLLPQFREVHEFNPVLFSSGLRLILWGLFKKIVIADRLALLVQPVFGQPEYFHGIQVVIAMPLLMMQVYADFSGYTDIAIGSARLMGFRLSPNFNRPFAAKSIAAFWNRWHITLTTWLRDYVYFSLPSKSGGRVKSWKLNLNLIITFLLVGFWHGANWNFLAFGLLHGIYMALANIFKPELTKFNQISGLARFPKLLSAVNITATFFLICTSGFFFGQHPFSDSLTLIRNITEWSNTSAALLTIVKNNDFLLGTALIVFMLWFEYITMEKSFKPRFQSLPVSLRYAAYMAMFFFMLIFGIFTRQEFFYFQF